ncbi:hypothetical protein E2C01_004214 [Portunus trituberculatus]|uniref:Uncharacterized protein n=1 Tax=Portunus trituberculatus TaxID=210409 RepID=A0A5B7CPA6_PORTR|nr:hypothetical protein [Portunus trituberculatus]
MSHARCSHWEKPGTRRNEGGEGGREEGEMERKWNHACFRVREVFKRMGSNPGHGPSVGISALVKKRRVRTYEVSGRWQWSERVGVVGGADDSVGGAAVTLGVSAATIGTCHPRSLASEASRARRRSLTPHAPPRPARLAAE